MLKADNDMLNALLDRLSRIRSREDQLAMLRNWLDRLINERDAERSEERLETLGKLGGG